MVDLTKDEIETVLHWQGACGCQGGGCWFCYSRKKCELLIDKLNEELE
jgi:hypothetical protein